MPRGVVEGVALGVGGALAQRLAAGEGEAPAPEPLGGGEAEGVREGEGEALAEGVAAPKRVGEGERDEAPPLALPPAVADTEAVEDKEARGLAEVVGQADCERLGVGVPLAQREALAEAEGQRLPEALPEAVGGARGGGGGGGGGRRWPPPRPSQTPWQQPRRTQRRWAAPRWSAAGSWALPAPAAAAAARVCSATWRDQRYGVRSTCWCGLGRVQGAGKSPRSKQGVERGRARAQAGCARRRKGAAALLCVGVGSQKKKPKVLDFFLDSAPVRHEGGLRLPAHLPAAVP